MAAALLLFASLAGASSLGYDPEADPVAESRSAVAEARAGDKRILVLVGGEWCSWCHVLDRFVKGEPEIHRLWDQGYVTLKVHWEPEHPNQEFLDRYPKIAGYPHIFVLDRDGTFLHSQNTGDLEEGGSYNEEMLLAFLDDWMPSKGGL
mgnify:CR=1 FL=1